MLFFVHLQTAAELEVKAEKISVQEVEDGGQKSSR